MGETDFSSADPWGIPVEEVELEAPDETTPEPVDVEKADVADLEEPTASEDQAPPADAAELGTEAPPKEEESPPESADTERDVEPEPPADEAQEVPSGPEVEDEEVPTTDESDVGAAVAESGLKALSIPEVTAVADDAAAHEPDATEPTAWEPDDVRPETKARGFSQMLAAALTSIRREEPTDATEASEGLPAEPGEEVPDAEVPGGDVLDETPTWMIEGAASAPPAAAQEVAPAEELDPWAHAQAVEPADEHEETQEPAEETPEPAGEPTDQAPEPAEEPTDQAPEPAEGPAAEAHEAAEEPAAEAHEAAEEPAAEAHEAAEESAEEAPEAAEEIEVGEEADLDDLVASLEVAAAVEEISPDAEIELPETQPAVFSELEELTEAEAQEVVTPAEETTTEEDEERIVAASPGVEWGSRWRETAQGWVESEDGRSTWRPIVATSDTVAQWDVDTYLGVAAGDVAVKSTGDPEAVVSEARAVALQRMLDDAVARGAHAVVGTEVAVHEIGARLVVTATGTAVTLQARD